MKKLAVILALLTAMGLALAQRQGNFYIRFPEYVIVLTDFDAVYWTFDTDTDPGTGAGKAQYVSGVYTAWTGGLADCFSGAITGTVTPQNTAGTASVSTTCYFAPTSIVKGGDVTVDWSANYGSIAPDTTLVVVTNTTSFKVTATLTTAWQNASDAGANILVLADATDDGSNWLSGTTPTTGSFTTVTTTGSVILDTTASVGLSKPTNYANVYAVPNIWAVSLDPTAMPNISTDELAVITFDGASLP